jgi:hypothetical protein
MLKIREQDWAACAVKGEGNFSFRAGSETGATRDATKQMERTDFIDICFSKSQGQKKKKSKAIPVTGSGGS